MFGSLQQHVCARPFVNQTGYEFHINIHTYALIRPLKNTFLHIYSYRCANKVALIRLKLTRANALKGQMVESDVAGA